MNFRKLALAAATLAVLAPAISNASPEKAAVDACARAFASSLAVSGGAAPTFKIDYRNGQYSGSMLQFYTRQYTFELHANDRKTGVAVARASCSTNSYGAVVALSPIPLDAARSVLAARL
jgi:hypothetical protein